VQLAFTFPRSPANGYSLLPESGKAFHNPMMSNDEKPDSTKTAAEAEAAAKLRNKALRLLTTREHSREELMRKLAQAKARRARNEAKAPPPAKDDISRLIDDLVVQGWQSDERYAEAIVRRLTGQASRRFIEDKLAQTGIKKDVAQLALEGLEQDEHEVATALWERRYGNVPTDDKERQRQIRFLLSRGFHLGDAFKIVPRVAPPTQALDTRHVDVGLAQPAAVQDALRTSRTGLQRSAWGSKGDSKTTKGSTFGRGGKKSKERSTSTSSKIFRRTPE
jgi:regulatory protein